MEEWVGKQWDRFIRRAAHRQHDVAAVSLPQMQRSIGLMFRAAGGGAAAWSSLGHRLGERRDLLITDCAAWWALGNTPFEREAAYRRCLADGLAADRTAALAAAVRKGWAVGDAAFLAALAQQTDRPVQPRPRGRPPRAA